MDYQTNRWGEGYFEVGANGHLFVRPEKKGAGDLYELVQTLVQQGIEAPILLRFNGIVRDRIAHLHKSFQAAIQELNYRGSHRLIYPVKVNPQRHVVENVQLSGKPFQVGLEVGSKPELMAVMALESDPDSLLLCNGYKDVEYIELALMARKLGRRTLVIIEQFYELKMVMQAAEKLQVTPEIGFRMKLSQKGAGRWQSSGGEHSKFGLFAYEIYEGVETLLREGKGEWLKLLHYHLGSQITSIEAVKNGLKEGARMYTELARLLPSLTFFDVGGGLAVDYDGSRSGADSSMNYTLDEYARDVVAEVGEACLEAGCGDPILLTESGRAVVAHHAVLITEVIDVSPENKFGGTSPEVEAIEKELSLATCREAFHDVLELKERTLDEFIYGNLSLEERARVEKGLTPLLLKIQEFYKQLPEQEEEQAILNQALQETYFCNFSVFQSLPDAWAIGQLFPIMPIHRLAEEGSLKKASLADLTCDSDGKIEKFIDGNTFLPLQPYLGEPYYLGIFLVGAYQEILGGLHNLFGDANVVHAELYDNGEWHFTQLVEGDTVGEVLHYVQYNTEQLLNQLHERVEESLKAKRLTLPEAAQLKKKFKESLESYTYLVI